jgi:hypothetical protein
MLAAPKLKLFFRCGESESARWISDTIGEYEVEKPRIATTASVEDRGRDALNYSTTTEQRQAISKEEIMSLPDLHGYWKYGDAVVPFRLPLATVKIVTRGYIARELPPSQIDPKAFAEQLKRPHGNESDEVVAKTLQSPPDTRLHEHAIAANVIQNQHGADVATSSRYQAEHLPTAESQSTDLCNANAAESDVDEFHYQQD